MDATKIRLLATSLGGEVHALSLVKDLTFPSKWNPKPRRRRSTGDSGGKLPPIWGVGGDGIAVQGGLVRREEGGGANVVDFESSKFAGKLAHCLFVFVVANYGIGIGEIQVNEQEEDGGEGNDEVGEEIGEREDKDEDEKELARFDRSGIGLVIKERLEFREGDVELTRVDLAKVENVALQLKKQENDGNSSIIEICYPAGNGAEDIVTNVEKALGEQGISMGRLRRNPQLRRRSTTTTITFKTVQTIHLDCQIEFSSCSSELDLYSDDETPTSSTKVVLSQVARLLASQPFHHVVIEGHTDDRHNPFGTNLQLSQDRADAVRGYLVDMGVGESRVKAMGFGEKVRWGEGKQCLEGLVYVLLLTLSTETRS
jgi:outer membrane protein OmpA-like peptidoglycan-associated protein